MIVADLKDKARYYAMVPGLKKLFDFIESHDLLNMPLGRVEVDGDEVFINNQELKLVPDGERPLEMHRRYIDVQIPLTEPEKFGWKAIEDIKEFSQPYDEKGDCALSAEAPQFYVDLAPGKFVVVWPEDAHAPGVGFGTTRKLIGKIRV